jgi:hypothetical protein
MREIRKSGSEGGAGQTNVPFLPLSEQPATRYPLPATVPQALSLDSGLSPLDSPTSEWARYEQENSWEQNVQKVLEALLKS